MKTVMGSVLARAYLPTPKEIKDALVYADLGVKMQIIFYELSSALFWCSVGELMLFLFAFLIFLPDAKEMGGIFYHTLHVGRGAIGVLILRKLPTLH
jgi:hypothetical protein